MFLAPGLVALTYRTFVGGVSTHVNGTAIF